MFARFSALALISSAAIAQPSTFLYESNGVSSDVWAYSVNASTGVITKTSASPFPGQNVAHSIAVTPNNQFVYVANANANSISAYVITPATGNLISVIGSPFATHFSPHSVAVDPTGRFLYAGNSSSSDISGYTINATTGALMPIAGSPFADPAGSIGFSMAIDPTGTYLYAPNVGAGTVSAYTINANTGVLAPIPRSPSPAGTLPSWVAIHPNGHYLYVTNASGSVYAFQINGSTGALSPVPGSPFPASGGRGLAIDPQGRFLYVTSEVDYTVRAYRINPSGALTQTSGSPYHLFSDPTALIVDPTSQFLYVANAAAGTVSAFQINQATGDLIGIAGSPFASGTEPLCFAFATEVLSNQLSVQYLQPTQGGNAGTVTMQVIGNGFQNGVAVKLAGLGPDIVATSVAVANVSDLIATFDLTGATPGIRNVVVTNPDNTTFMLTGGFTVEQGGAPQISVDIVGKNAIRIGTPQAYYAVVQNNGSIDAPIVALTLSSSGDAQLSLSSASRVSSLAAVKKGTELGSKVANQASSMASALQPIYVGPVTSGSSMALPIPILEPSPSCSLFQGFAYNLTSVSCDVLGNVSDTADAYLNKLYALWLANTISWAKGITPIAQGGLGTCFNLADYSTEVSCLVYKITDASLEALIKGAEDAKSKVCGLQMAAQCPSNCLLPQSLTDIAGIAKGLHDAEDQLEPLFNMATVPIPEVTSIESQVALFATQAISLPSIAFPPEPLNPLPVDGSASLQVCGVTSLDPNDKVGPQGVGPSQFISSQAPVPYSVYFDNQPTATAPAQAVTVKDTLSNYLDLNSVVLGPITFPNQVVTPPSIPLFVASFTTTVDLRPATNLLVKVTATLNATTGLLSWTFQSLDPATGLPTTDPLAGFLPPGAEGSVFFTVMPKSTVTTGTVIQNTATVVFDNNAPINTPTWSNTIDNTSPTSQVNQLPAIETTANFMVSWAGSDFGAGVQDYTVYSSENDAAFTAWETNVTATSAMFAGTSGHTYRFYSIARDLVGNVEPAKSTAEATTTVTTPPTIQCTGCYFLVNGIRATLAFNVASVGSTSTFTYNYRTSTQAVQFVSTTTSQIAVNGNTATFGGQGKLNGVAGYNFTVVAKDGGAVGSGLDTVSISITGSNSYSYSTNATIVGGDVVVKQ